MANEIAVEANTSLYSQLIKSREPSGSLKYTLVKLLTNKRFVINAICLGYSIIISSSK